MSDGTLDSVACALFILGAFSAAGCAQAMWLSSPVSQRLAWPLDCGLTFRRRRVFGANKTVRGFVVMVPATALAFALIALTEPAGVWRLTTLEYAVLGGVAGMGFMLAELPNSFVKRQLRVAPGAPVTGWPWRPLFAFVDHGDSVCGALAAMAVVVRIPIETAISLIAVGWVVHVGFSALTFHLGGKVRAA